MTVIHSRRQLPRWRAVAPVRPQAVVVGRTRRRLAAAATVADLRAVALRRTPRRVFDYTDGGAGNKIPWPATGRPTSGSSSGRACSAMYPRWIRRP